MTTFLHACRYCAVIALFSLLLSPGVHAQQVVRVGLYQNPPKVFSNTQGEPSGFFVDVLNAIAEEEDWALEYRHCAWENCLKMLQRGELDLLPDVAYSDARDRRFDFHHEVVLSNWSMLYAVDPRNMQSVLDLDAKRVAVITGSIQYTTLQRRVKQFSVSPVFIEQQSSADTLKAVAAGQADAALVNRLYGLAHAEEYGLQPTHILIESSRLYYAAPQGRNGDLLLAIDLQLTGMKEDPDSAYYAAMHRWVESLESDTLPLWFIWTLQALAILLLVLLLASISLRHMVRRNTSELRRKNDALEQSEAMFRTLFETSQDAMMISGGEDFIDCNPAMLRMFRYPDVASMRQLRRDDLFPPYQSGGDKSSPCADDKIRQALTEGYAHFEWTHRRADGTTFPSEVTLVPMEINNRQVVQATIRDISRRKQNEVSMRQLNRALQTLSQVNHILVHARDESALLNDICRTIVESGGYRLAWIGFARHDDARTVEPVAQFGFEEGYLSSLKISWKNDDYGNGPTGIAIRTGNPSIVRDIHNDPKFAPWREQAIQRDYASSIALPLIKDNVTLGALNIYSRYPDAFGDSEIMLLGELADDIAFGIHTQRLNLEHTDIEEERKGHKLRLQEALLQTIQAITVMVEKRDPFTAGHQRRVADLAVAIAQELDFDEVRQEGIRFGAMIHDIGNIYVPAEILNRPGKLSESELQIVRSHPSVGYDIVKDINFPWPVADMILHHQERLDGSGYPDGLKGDSISLEARIIGVADVVEAMLSHRPYRASFSVEEMLQEIERYRGIKYDAQAVDACARLFRDKNYTLPV